MSRCPSGSMTVTRLVAHWAEVDPNGACLTFDPINSEPEDFTFGDVERLSTGAALHLIALGVKHGDRVCLVSGNHPEFVFWWIGAAIAHAVAVPVNPNSTAEDVAYFVEHSKSRVLICAPDRRDVVAAAELDPGVKVVPIGVVRENAPSTANAAPTAEPLPMQPMSILYTSGTTSRPKGVIVTHANYLSAGSTLAAQLRMRPDDRWLITLPLFHANAQYYCIMSALVSGASVVVSARFSASKWASQVRTHGATLASLFAAPIRMILACETDTLDADNLLRATIFAQNLSSAQLEEFQDRFGCPLLQLYGMTETIAPPLMNALYGPRDSMTLGLPTTPGRVRIVDENLSETTVGEPGEILVGGVPGETLMLGYLDDDDATASAFADGWLRTGDIAIRRVDGSVTFHDRAKDMIKRAGENVAAVEVEGVLNQHEGVFESAVIGVPDDVYDETIKAFVVLTDKYITAADLHQHCQIHLARGKRPDTIVLVEELPRTAVGKIRKTELRDPL